MSALPYPHACASIAWQLIVLETCARIDGVHIKFCRSETLRNIAGRYADHGEWD